jgi:ABC-type multidrug transport system fused ATPase/permease subunit
MSSDSLDEGKLPKKNDEPTLEPITFIDRNEIDTLTRIATEQSRRQSTVNGHRLTSVTEQDPSLDPASPKFDLQKWLLAAMDGVGRDGRDGQNMGIVFKNVNVFGSGAALQFQETVSSLLSAPLRLGQVLQESRSPRRRILKDFNGLLKKGELLLVLGRPGAGCSTFLKSLCGEHHGLELDENSVIHYNGNATPVMSYLFSY